MQIKIETPDAASPKALIPGSPDDRILGLSLRTLEIEAIQDDADAFAAFAAIVLVAEGDESVPVLKPDSAKGLQARRG